MYLPFGEKQFFRFVEGCWIAEINVPIIPAIMTVIDASKIKRMIAKCGAASPGYYRQKNFGSFLMDVNNKY